MVKKRCPVCPGTPILPPTLQSALTTAIEFPTNLPDNNHYHNRKQLKNKTCKQWGKIVEQSLQVAYPCCTTPETPMSAFCNLSIDSRKGNSMNNVPWLCTSSSNLGSYLGTNVQDPCSTGSTGKIMDDLHKTKQTSPRRCNSKLLRNQSDEQNVKRPCVELGTSLV